MKSKGLSVLLSSVVMVVIVLAIAGIVANWSAIFARERAGGVVGQTETMLECSGADLFINSVEIDCQNNCANNGEKKISFVARNTGNVHLDIDKFYITNKNGNFSEFILPEQITVTSGAMMPSYAFFYFDCDEIVNNIDKFEIISLNCPKQGRDSLSGKDVTFINCE